MQMLDAIVFKYFALDPTLSLDLPISLHEFASLTILSELGKRFPAPLAYRKNVLSKLLRHAALDADLEELLYEKLSFIFLETEEENSEGYAIYFPDHTFVNHIILYTGNLSNSVLVSNGTTGLRVWEASKHLCKYLHEHHKVVRGTRVLELGAGTGLVGLFAGKMLQASEVHLSDVSEKVLQNLSKSITANSCDCNAKTLLLDWEAEQEFHSYDVVLGADIVYDPRLVKSLVRVLGERISFEVALICCTVRNQAVFEIFLDLLGRANLCVSVENLETSDSPLFFSVFDEGIAKTVLVKIFKKNIS